MPRSLVIVNPWTRRPQSVTRVVAELEARRWQMDIAYATDPRKVEDLVRDHLRPDHDLVVAVGGDGTVAQVAAALTETGIPVAIVPAGTANLLAANLRIPGDVGHAAALLTAGRVRQIDLGEVALGQTQRPFLVAVGVGFDAEVMQRTGRVRKRYLGKLAYFATAVSLGARLRNRDVTITIDGRRHTTMAAQVFVANVGEMARTLRPRRPFVPDDGVFDVIVIRADGPIGGLRAAHDALRFTDLGHHPAGRVFRASGACIQIDVGSPQPAEVDGDFVGFAPLTVRVLPGAASILVPSRQ